ncbi:chitinase protein [Halorhabdus tiamatea SARL4B]|uniref:Chitinase protein n=1 Tax=Halorhabdus tiamatea SARL4B TaxID=1033806 RepID=F7PG71_9EURY|nr:PKD domain-containing protein [Halorhabdus tiamatea]ERJ06328.1 chitinase protein [Halorhabdus tiamatea SARL4B]CCQ34620.1 hypothetical PKD domain protein [Halorhabdus tiamatea SARL4B]
MNEVKDGVHAQSEVTGVVLLTAVVVILSVIVGGAILTNIDTQDEPVANLEATVDATNVTISHQGGTQLSTDEVTVYFRSGNTERHSLSTIEELQGNFDPGETVRHTHNATGVVTVFVVHEPSNTLLYDRDFDVPLPLQDTTAPIANLSITPTVPTVGEAVTLDASDSVASNDSIIGYAWDLDGDWNYEQSGNATITKQFTDPGNQTIRVRVADSKGGTNTTSQQVRINAPPVAAFTSNPRPAIVNKTVLFTASNSIDPDGSITSYDWDFNNDSNFEASGTTSTQTFDASGVYPVTLRVTDADNETNTTSTTITVTDEPLARFTYSPNAPGTGEGISFDASASNDPDGSILSYDWDFDGDGTVDGSGESVTHTYYAPYRYNVTLNVTDDSGASNVTTQTVLANSPPDANFTSNCEGSECGFDASTSTDDGTIANYTWTFDDGNTTTTNDPVLNHTYAQSGTYNVTLTGTDGFGATNATSQTISVDTEPPTIENATLQDGDGNAFVTNGDTVSISATVSDSFSGISTATADASSLDAGTVTLTDPDGDGIYNATISVGASPTEGSQSVTITAVDNASNTASAMTNTLTVDITPPSITNFSVVDESEFNFIVIYWEFIESFGVEWETTDDHLVQTTVYVNRSGTLQDTYPGQSGDETYENTRMYETSGREHTVTIVAVDEAGNEACRTVTDTADGSDPPDSAYKSC